MKWYTLENGRLCLGTEKHKFANFHIATEVNLTSDMSFALTPEHVELIGSYPEDWYNDEAIDTKINNAARHFFGLTEPSSSALLA